MNRLSGRVALVTGASRGLGEAIARAFAAEGASVVCADIRDELGQRVCEDMTRAGLQARYRHLDISSVESWHAAISSLGETEGRLDILVNNGGVNLRKTIDALSLEEWNNVIGINLNGALLGIKFGAPLMRDGGGGSIINIASISGLGASPNVAYGTSKWALRGLTRSAAFEYGRWGIRVNAILPGVIETELNTGLTYMEHFQRATPLGKLATPADIAAMATFLASADSSSITGQDHVVDGGFTSGHRPEVSFKPAA